MNLDDESRIKFILAHTELSAAALSSHIRLHLATSLTPLWQASEAFLNQRNLAPPFWAFAWPGAQALALYIQSRPDLVEGRRVLDFAAGCGLAAIEAARNGAQTEAAEIDELACAAIRLNAAANNVNINILKGDIAGDPCRWDIILCGDVCYEAPMTRRILPWLRNCARSATVLMADPGRAYAPREALAPIATYTIPTSRELEDREFRRVSLFRLLAG